MQQPKQTNTRGTKRATGASIGGNAAFTACILTGFAMSGLRASALEASDVLVFSKGPLSLRPHAAVSSEYNDNVLYRDTNPKGDLITDIGPGLKIQLGDNVPQSNHAIFDYRLDQVWYLDEKSLNDLQHRLTFDGRYATERTTVQGSDLYQIQSTPLSGGYSFTGTKVGSATWRDHYRIDYRLGDRMGTYAELTHNFINYEEGIPLFDNRVIQGTLGFQWKLSVDTYIFGEGYYGATLLDANAPGPEPPGNTFAGGFVGARGTFTTRLTGIVKVGYETYEFDKTSVTAGGGATSGSAPVVEGSVSYRITDRLTGEATYSRRQRVSSEFSRAAYIASEGGLSLAAVLGSADRLRLGLAGRFGTYDYNPSPTFASRTDTLWIIETSARWLFETWLSMSLRYEYSNFQSNLPGLVEYAQNRITIGAQIGF